MIPTVGDHCQLRRGQRVLFWPWGQLDHNTAPPPVQQPPCSGRRRSSSRRARLAELRSCGSAGADDFVLLKRFAKNDGARLILTGIRGSVSA